MSRLLLKWICHSSPIFISSSARTANRLKYALNKTSYWTRRLAHTDSGIEIDERGEFENEYPLPDHGYRWSGKPRGRPKRIRKISTLDPKRFTQDDYLDLSGLRVATLWLRSSMYYGFYAHKKDKEDRLALAFPRDTRGFFYYHTPKILPLTAAAVRFRICDSKETFDAGHDLLKPDGSVWEVSNWMLAMVQTYQPLKRVLVEDGMLSEDTLKECQTLSAGMKFKPRRIVTYAMGQPFPAVMGRTTTSVYVASKERLAYLQIFNHFMDPFCGTRLPEDTRPEGLAAQLCFDYDSETDNVVLRLLKLPELYRDRIRLKEGDTTILRYRARYGPFVGADAIRILRESRKLYPLSHTG